VGRLVDEVYAQTGQNSAASATVTEFYSKNSPFDLLKKQTVDASVESIVQQSPKTYEVTWTEVTRDLVGQFVASHRFRARILPCSAVLDIALSCLFLCRYSNRFDEEECRDYPEIPTILKECPYKNPYSDCGRFHLWRSGSHRFRSNSTSDLALGVNWDLGTRSPDTCQSAIANPASESELAIMRSREPLRINWQQSLVRAAGYTATWNSQHTSTLSRQRSRVRAPSSPPSF
jgi:hypothetical protein